MRRVVFAGLVLALTANACGGSSTDVASTSAPNQSAVAGPAGLRFPPSTVVEGGTRWAVLPSGASVARATPPPEFTLANEFLMFPGAGDDFQLRVVQKFTRGEGDRQSVLDLHTVIGVSDHFRASFAEPPPGFELGDLGGRQVWRSASTAEAPTVVTWLGPVPLVLEVFAVGAVTEAELERFVASVAVEEVQVSRRLEVAG